MTNSQSKEPNPMEVLKDRHRVVVEEYCTGAQLGRQFHKSNAMKAAGYSESRTMQSKVFDREDVKAAINYRLAQVTMGPQEVAARFASIASANIGDLLELDPVSGIPRIKPDKLDEARPLIAEFGVDSNGFAKYKFHDAHAALRDLAKVFGMNKDSHTVSGPNGGAVPVEMVIKFEDPS